MWNIEKLFLICNQKWHYHLQQQQQQVQNIQQVIAKIAIVNSFGFDMIKAIKAHTILLPVELWLRIGLSRFLSKSKFWSIFISKFSSRFSSSALLLVIDFPEASCRVRTQITNTKKKFSFKAFMMERMSWINWSVWSCFDKYL